MFRHLSVKIALFLTAISVSALSGSGFTDQFLPTFHHRAMPVFTIPAGFAPTVAKRSPPPDGHDGNQPD